MSKQMVIGESMMRFESYWYLSGPMEDQPEHGIPTLAEAAALLRATGEVVWNPGEHPIAGVPETMEYGARLRLYMVQDLPMVAGARGVIVLPGWEDSTGCCLEVWTAMYLGLPVLRFETWAGKGTFTADMKAEVSAVFETLDERGLW